VRANGTVRLVADINSGGGDSNPYEFAEHDGELYFQALRTGEGYEVWKIGRSGPPTLVADVEPGIGDSDPVDFIPFPASTDARV
jgi:ELWxxDGT repeat protein